MKKINRHTYWTCCAAMMFLSISLNAGAESDDSGPVHRPLFDDDSTLAITIEGPLNTVMRNRDETEEFPALFKFSNADGTATTLDIKLRVRGKFRRKRETCNFAPLRVNFKKSQLEGTVFAGQNTIKLVTDCQSGKKTYQQYLLKEYLAYKFLNVLTDRSFSARLLRVTYVDTDKKGKSRDSFAFFIEEKNHIADRLGMDRLKLPKTKYSALDPAHTNLVNVYEYFIANTDYSLVLGPKGSNCCHNAVLYKKDSAPIITIPYDFDHAGLINAPYASPNPKFKIKSVKTRIYRGRCANNSLLDATFKMFLDNKDALTKVVTDLDGYDERSIKGTMKMVDGFYKDITTPKNIEKRFIKKCS
jgi:hypothetical protein